MPRDASGNYTPPAGNPVAAGAVITTTWANPTVTDIGTELTASLDRNGQGGMLAGLKAFAGVVTLPGISFTSEVTSGLYYNTTADLRFSVLGADTTRWVDDSATPAGSQEPFELWNGSAWVKAIGAGGEGVTSVGGTGTVNGITLTGTVTSTGNLTLGGALTGVDLTSQITGILPVANGGTGVAASTGTVAVVLSTSPTLVTPNLGTPSALVATNATGTALGLTSGVTKALKSASTSVDVSASSAPVLGQVLTATAGTTATWQTPATGGGLEATASGVLANGDAVIVNADGTVSIIAGSSASDGLGSDVIYDGYATTTAATYDSVNDKVVVVYMAGASAGSAQVGTVSGSSISFGTKVAFNATAYNTGLCIDFDVNAEKVVVMWGDPSSNLIAAVGTVSGTSISFGAAVTISTNIRGGDIALGYDENAQKHLAFYVSNATGQKAYAVVLTVSGTTLDTVPTAVEFMATQSYNAFRPQGPSYDSTGQKIVIFYNDYSNSESGRARACTISGTTVSFGTPVEFDNGNSEYFSAAYSPSLNKHMVVWRNYSNARYVDSAIATLSGTTITFGTTVTVQSAASTQTACAWDTTASKFVVAALDTAVTKAKIYVGTVTGTSAAFTGPTVFAEFTIGYTTLIYDPDVGKVALMYQVDSNSNGAAAVWTTGFFSSNMTATNFIGFSDAAYADGVTATIQLISEIDDAQSGLTAGLAYYVQADGSIAATPDDLSVYAGVAASATKIIIKG